MACEKVNLVIYYVLGDKMKLMIASDIHGNFENTKILIDKFNNSKADKLIILGDIYHGYSYTDTRAMMDLFSTICTKLILIKGNCDSEFDVEQSTVSMYKEYSIRVNSRTIYFNHGHLGYPNVCFNKGDIYCHGHTHINEIVVSDIIRCCPGSITLPRANTPASYMIIDEKGIYIYNFNDLIIKQYLFEV